MTRVSLTVDIPTHSSTFTRDNNNNNNKDYMSDAPGYFNPKNESSYSFTRTGSQHPASPSSLISPMMTPVTPALHFQTKGNPAVVDNAKRISEYEFPTAVKVDSLYQSYLNHPFNQHIKNNDAKHSPRLHKPQAYNVSNKYSNYTKGNNNNNNNNKNFKLVTISNNQDNKDKSGIMMDLGSPTLLASPPPPYIHTPTSQQGFETDVKEGAANATTKVSRPSLARVLPPQAIPILTTTTTTSSSASSPTFGPSSADACLLSVPATTISPNNNNTVTMSMGRLALERNETETETETKTKTLYNLQMAEDVSPKADIRGQQPLSRVSALVESSSCQYQSQETTFPSFWEDARQNHMHWVFLSFGCMLVGSAVWVIVMQVFMEWVIVMPAATVALCALQYGSYRWKRNRFNKRHQQHKEEEESPVYSSRNQYAIETAAALAQDHHQHHQRRGDETAFLEPHQPMNSSFSLNSQDSALQQQHASFKQPRHHTVFQQESYKHPRLSTSNATSSSSTKKQIGPKMPMTVNPVLYRPSAYSHGQFLSPVDSPQTPPPAYFLKRIELPEINSIGDLVGEFEIDLSSIKY
ncbi:hypothetical protein BG004_002391 [Podila humilis]|nr:hypothetical protein BG004_002391 [Podila humilis]